MRQQLRRAAQQYGVPAEAVVEAVASGKPPEPSEPPRTRAVVPVARTRPRRRVGLWITCVVVGLGFGLVIVFVLKFVNGEVKSGPLVDEQINAARKSIEPAPEADPTLRGAKIAFSYPAQFKNVVRGTGEHNVVEQYTLNNFGFGGASIAVTVSNLSSGDFRDDSGYMFRTTISKDYAEEQAKGMKEPAVVFTKHDGSEKTFYWAHKGMLVVVSVTTTSGGDIAAYLREVMTTLRWTG